MRAQLSLALVTLFLAACAADDTPAAMGGTGDSESSTGTPGMTSSPMTTAPSTDGMTMGGTADGTGTTMADPSTGPDPDDSSTGTPPADSSSSDGGMVDSSSSDGGVAESSSSSDGGVAESSSSSDGGVAESSSSSDGGVAESSSSSGGQQECIPILCGGAMLPAECGDCIDNDGDGTLDGFDTECINPCDDDESSFATGIPGDNIDLCHQDCFFDGNSGGGDDGCDWWLACDPLDPDNGECSIPGGQTCPADQSQECIDNCQVPNGCDCFGCCTVNVDGEDHNILIGADGCSLDNFAACPECTQVPACTDPCDPTDCELCFGETELPPGCEEPTCPDGQTSCESNADCTADYFCQTGCCELIPV